MVESHHAGNHFISSRFSPQLAYHFKAHFAVFAGPALALLTSDSHKTDVQAAIGEITRQSPFLWERITIHDHVYQLRAGVSVGVRLF
jgi:hypothetical protein